jgi:predicted NUDIX family NTP pyrophosphohydrolase
VDKAKFFDFDMAKKKINSAQVAFLTELERLLK